MLIQKKDKWCFLDKDNRAPLSSTDVAYFKRVLFNIIKVGQEFELNLPEQKGTCQGDNNACPCKNISTEKCWLECANTEFCEATRSTTNCDSVTPLCKDEDCETCTVFKLKCSGILCTSFITKCMVCEEFKAECDTCPSKYDPEKNPDNIRANICNELLPTNSYGKVGKYGIHSVTTDGSLLGNGGVEVITNGRRIDYFEFLNMAKKIIDSVLQKGAFVNERCSTHMHVLTTYHKYGNTKKADEDPINELERPIPEIILANFHQLIRRYQNAMTWMTSALPELERLTRWEKFRVSVIEISPAYEPMSMVARKVHSKADGKKYGWVNYDNVRFDQNGDVNRFHVEMRGADGILSPSAIAAIACLYFALLIKATEISRYGLLEVFTDKKVMEEALEAKEALLNNRKGYHDGDRFSNTTGFEKYQDVYIRDSLDLIRIVKPILAKLGPAYDVLEALAIRPVSLRRCEGETWEEIEKDLEVQQDEEDRLHNKVRELIHLQMVIDCVDSSEWVRVVKDVLKEDDEIVDKEVIDCVDNLVMAKQVEGQWVWSNRIGTMLIVE